MTYQEKFEELRKKFATNGERYMQAENKFSSILGWGDSLELTDFLDAKRKFEETAQQYNDFLSYVRENRIKPEQEYNAAGVK